jgi:signal transduction histidine kinase
VMEFAGINAGSAVRTRPDVSVRAIVDAAIQSVTPEARDRDITINLDAGDGLPPIAGDPDALRSAVQNIVGNAVKYSPAASAVDVTVRSNKGSVRIDVVDRGLGIDASDVPHIFKPFFRGRRALDAQVRGSGVGLSVVRHVIDRHHGHVTVASRVGEGTTVSVMLPVSS